MIRKAHVLWIMLLLLFTGVILGNIPLSEREALIALYNATDGDNWNRNENWKTGGIFSPPGTENTWAGVTCNAINTTIIRISLTSNNLNGVIPGEIGHFSNLDSLNLTHNPLSGSLPPEIGNLTNLRILRCYRNQLTGHIPPELGNCTNLEVLQIFETQISGTIPPELGNLSNLIRI